MTDLSPIISRVEAAGEGSRELNRLIEIATQIGAGEHHDARMTAEGYVLSTSDHPVYAGHGRQAYLPRDYTGSVDSALALVERCLPGWIVTNLCEWEHEELRARGPWMAQLKPRGSTDIILAADCRNAPTPALALCLALLRALQSKGGEHGEAE